MRLKKALCLIVSAVVLLSMLPCPVLASEGPILADGNHVRWIDRIADLPDYAAAFYRWLEENAVSGGALTDPTKTTELSGSYVHLVHTYEATTQFQYTSGSSVRDQALEAAISHAGDASEIVMDYIFDVYGAFDRDHPEVFWLNTECICGVGIDYDYATSGSVRQVDYKLKIYFYLQSEDYDVRMEGFRSPAQITAAIQKRDQDVQRILADCPTDGSVQAQVRYFNQVLTRSNAYNSAVFGADGTNLKAWKCISALAGSTGAQGPVCEGYARAFKVLCDALDIPCVLTSGYARNKASATPQQHMWNYVSIDGQWYAVDVTWNDPTAKSKPDAAVSGYEQEDWLLLGSRSVVADGMLFADSHVVYNQVQSDSRCYTNGPVLAQYPYSVAQCRMDVTAYRNGAYTAPVKEGYVFAGWFTDPEMTQPLNENVKTGFAYAKFVEADTLAVKYQISSGTTGRSAETDLRLLTGVASLDYSSVVFEVTLRNQQATLPCTAVYEKIITGETKIENASAIFGADARYFAAYTLLNIPRWLFDTDITIIPRWKTLDGTVVRGTARTLRISDSFS